MNFCKNCGSDLRDKAVYCHRCGTKLLIHSNTNVNNEIFDSASKPPFNRQMVYAYIWLLVTLLFLSCTVLPFVVDIDMMNGGGAMVFIGAVMFITGLIVTPFFFKRAKRFSEIVSGKNTIIHWTYNATEWQQYTQEEYTRRKKQSWGIFLLITGIMFIVFLIMGIVLEDGMPIMIMLFISMTAIIALSAWLSYTIPYRRNKKRIGEAIIAPSGIYLNSSIHIWKGLSAKFERVFLDENDTILVFIYSARVQHGRREEYSVNVPVPEGKLDEAYSVIAYFNKK